MAFFPLPAKTSARNASSQNGTTITMIQNEACIQIMPHDRRSPQLSLAVASLHEGWVWPAFPLCDSQFSCGRTTKKRCWPFFVAFFEARFAMACFPLPVKISARNTSSQNGTTMTMTQNDACRLKMPNGRRSPQLSLITDSGHGAIFQCMSQKKMP